MRDMNDTWPDWWKKGILSLLAVLPCFWQPRLQAADLATHTYGVWLAQLIEQGKAPGLQLVSQTSNVLFDFLLNASISLFGFERGSQVATAVCVLVLFWGGFQLVSQLSLTKPWFLASSLLILCYGWTLHYGLMNFYLGLGLVVWGMVLFWEQPAWWKMALGAGLMALSLTAHPLPAAWGAGLLAYSWAVRKLGEPRWWWVMLAAIATIAGLRFYLVSHYRTFWQPPPVPLLPADQAWVFGVKYYAITVLLEIFWIFILWRLAYVRGFDAILRSIPFQMFVITIVFVWIFPVAILLPAYAAPLGFITERMTLPAGILLCVVLAQADALPWQRIGLQVVAVLFFFSLWSDSHALNRLEQRMESAIAVLPPRQRVVCSISDDRIRISSTLKSMCDRACIGRCFSYSFYEPSSLAFRIRPTSSSPVVVTDHDELSLLEEGGFVVQPEHLPMFQMSLCDRAGKPLQQASPDQAEFCLLPLQAGQVIKRVSVVGATPLLWSLR